MTITETKLDAARILRVAGRLDSATAQAAQDRFVACVASGERHLILDCSALDYISSAGLRSLLVAAKKLKPVGGQLVICGANDYVREIIELAGFDAFIGVCDSREQALDVFRVAAQPA